MCTPPFPHSSTPPVTSILLALHSPPLHTCIDIISQLLYSFIFFKLRRNETTMTDAYDIFLKHCKSGDLDAIKRVIQQYPNLDIHRHGDVALDWAAMNGHLNIVKHLTEQHQADIHAGDEHPLRHAAEGGHLDIVKYLIEEHNADIHVYNERPLFRAATNNHLDIVEYLITKGAEYSVFKDDEGWVKEYRICKEAVQKITHKKEQKLLQEKQNLQQKREQQEQLFKDNIQSLKKAPQYRPPRRRPVSKKQSSSP